MTQQQSNNKKVYCEPSENLFNYLLDVSPEDLPALNVGIVTDEGPTLNYDEDGWSEPVPLVPEIIGLLVSDDTVRFSRLDPEGQPWSKVKPYAEHYFSIQIKRRTEPYPIDKTHSNYYLLGEKDVVIPLGRFGNKDAAIAHAELVWSEYDGYVVTAETMNHYMMLIVKHEELSDS